MKARHRHLAHRRHAGGHVQYDRAVLTGRNHPRVRIVAHRGPRAAKRRGVDHSAVGTGETDHAGFGGQHRPVGGGAEVARVAHAGQPDAAGAGLVDRGADCPIGRDLSEAAVPVQDRERRTVEQGSDVGRWVDRPLFEGFEVVRLQSHHAVRIDPAQVGPDQAAGREPGAVGFDPAGAEQRRAEVFQFARVQADGISLIAHLAKPSGCVRPIMGAG